MHRSPKSTRRKPLSPGTAAQYQQALERAFGPAPYRGKADLKGWSPSTLKILHAAVLRLAPEREPDLPDPTYEVQRVIRPPTEADLVAYERALKLVNPPAKRALLQLPLALGLRASEVLLLKRADAERALDDRELLVLRKGGEEQLLPAGGVLSLLEDLLTAKDWTFTWQLLSATSKVCAYRTLHRLVQQTGVKAGVLKLRPHKLRHGFASRMERAGASLPQIQKMMNHASPEMTMRYVHPENKDLAKFLQQVKR